VASAAGTPVGAVPGRQVLAFDLYGTLADPTAIAGELGQVLGEAGGREAALLWRSPRATDGIRGVKPGKHADAARREHVRYGVPALLLVSQVGGHHLDPRLPLRSP
jgi:hypothetical protein